MDQILSTDKTTERTISHMKKIVNVNVGGFAFVIEEAAFEQLNAYLSAVKLNLGNDIDAAEVMNDIESRIAELFREELKSKGTEVVDNSLIEKVISVMGKPEDYGDGTEQKETAQQQVNEDYGQRTLFRNPDDKMLGGVASGLASYFGWEPLAFRIIFVLLVFGFGVGIPIYIVLWILIPEARSTADRLRMRGEPINVDTIKKRFNDFKGDINNLGGKEGRRKLRENANSVGSRIEIVFSDFGKAVGKVLGMGMLAAGLIILIFLVKYLVTGAVSIPQSAAEELFNQHNDLFFDNRFEYYCFIWGICTLLFVMLYGFISGGMDLLFRIKINNKPLKYLTVILGVVAMVAIVYGSVSMGKHYINDKNVSSRYDVPLRNNEVQVEVLKDEYFNNKVTSAYTQEDELIKVQQTRIIFGYPNFSIKRSETDKAYLEVSKTASGSRELQAIENCEAIDYAIQTDSGRIALPPVFSTSVKHKFRNQEVNITLYVPEKAIIRNTGNMKRIFNPYDSFMREEETMPDAASYVMTQHGLEEMK